MRKPGETIEIKDHRGNVRRLQARAGHDRCRGGTGIVGREVGTGKFVLCSCLREVKTPPPSAPAEVGGA